MASFDEASKRAGVRHRVRFRSVAGHVKEDAIRKVR
jgi:hypothetical protein